MTSQQLGPTTDEQPSLTICDKLSLYVLYVLGGYNGWKFEGDIYNEIWNLVDSHRVVAGLSLSLEAVRESLDKFCVLGVVETQRRARRGENAIAFHISITCEDYRTAYTLLDNIEYEVADYGYFAFENYGAEQAYNELVREVQRYYLESELANDTNNDLETVYEQQAIQELAKLA